MCEDESESESESERPNKALKTHVCGLFSRKNAFVAMETRDPLYH